MTMIATCLGTSTEGSVLVLVILNLIVLVHLHFFQPDHANPPRLCSLHAILAASGGVCDLTIFTEACCVEDAPADPVWPVDDELAPPGLVVCCSSI